MNFGFNGQIQPQSVVSGLVEEWSQENILFSIKDGLFEVSYFDEGAKDRAIQIANLYIQLWNFQNNIKITVKFNHSWEKKVGGTNHKIKIAENLQVVDRVVVTHSLTLGLRYEILTKSDSSSFVCNRPLVEKCLKNSILKEAFKYYSEEVADSSRPLYGIYKALEVLCDNVGGRNNLSQMAGKPEKFVDEIMETAQTVRHAVTKARKLLSDDECQQRAKILINAFAATIT